MHPSPSLSGTTRHQLAIEYLPLETLILDPENARIHKPAQIKQIAKSIEAFSFNVPVLVDRDNKVLAGHGRVLALKRLGRTEAPVIRLEHLTPQQARAFAIADNRLTETSEWDERLLALHLKGLAEIDLDFSLEATGFTMGEIDLKIEAVDLAVAAEAQEAASEEVDEPPPTGPAVAKPGDLWTLGRHKLLCGSALDAASYQSLLGAERAAMVFTDPPYNVAIDGNVSGQGKVRHREFPMASGEMSEAEFIGFLTQACTLMAAASRDGALHYVCMDWRHLFALLTAGRGAYDDLINLCVWAKTNGGMGSLYRSAHELVLVFKHGQASHRNNVQLGAFGRNRTNLWSYPGAGGLARGPDADLTAQHPTPKPVAMIGDAILDVTERGDLVLDPFLGSGSTLIAAETVGRVCAGVELDPLYVDLAIRRWRRMTSAEAVLTSTGETFGDLEGPPALALAA